MIWRNVWTIISKNPRTTIIGVLKFVILIVGLIGYLKGLGGFAEIAGALGVFYFAVDGVGNMLSKDGGTDNEEEKHFTELRKKTWGKGRKPNTAKIMTLLIVFAALFSGCKKQPIYSTTELVQDSTEVEFDFVIAKDQFDLIRNLTPGRRIFIKDKTISKDSSGSLVIEGKKRVPTIKEKEVVLIPTKQVDKSKTIINSNSNNNEKVVDKSVVKDKSKTNSGNKEKVNTGIPWSIPVAGGAIAISLLALKFKPWRLL